MTRRPISAPVFALAVALASCADLPKQTPAKTAPPTAQTPSASEPAYKKPVRMNGRGAIATIPLADFFTLQQSGKALIFDARPAFFYSLGHIPGAINLSKNHCDESIHAREAEIKAALAAGRTIVVYCSSSTCPDARTVAIHISGFGYPAKIFYGGMEEWREASMPTD